MEMTDNNLCDSCANIGCEFQSSIVRTKCAFYMPPHIEPDNCGNYVVQEPTTKNDLGVDTVSRKAVHDMLENLPITVEDKWFNWLQKACMRLAELPSVTPQEPRWIPVSERLPENNGCYLVTEKSGRVCTYVFHKEGNSEEYWKRCSVAWMPLPEPYKMESEDKE